MSRLSSAKEKILNLFYTIPGLTIYQIANTRKGIHSSAVRATAFHIKGLLEKELIRKCPNQIFDLPRMMFRFEYFELTHKGALYLGHTKKPDDFSIHYPSWFHQYGLRMALSSIYQAYCDKYEISGGAFKYGDKTLGFTPDYVLKFYDGTPHARIFEYECSRSMSSLVKAIESRNIPLRGQPFPKETKFVYIININSTDKPILPQDYVDNEYLEKQKLNEKFFNGLLERIKHLPSHKFRFAMLQDSEKYGGGAFKTPQGFPVKLI